MAALLSLAAPSSAADDEAPPSSNVIEFSMRARNSKGIVRCGLFRGNGWLKKPVQPATARINGGRALCVFSGIPKGTYGLSAFHDENENGKLDTNIVGMPIEDYCASRNARGTFGPPSFEDAKFAYSGGTKRLEARLK
jgi:uncharacterized protein (DUF2141 family)